MDRKDCYLKGKTPGCSSKQVRIKLRKEQSCFKREALVDSKRRIPLSALQEQGPSIVELATESKKPLSAKERSDLRLEKLREWKKVRDETKKKDKENKKVAFRFGVADRPFSISISAQSNSISLIKPKSDLTSKNGPLKQKPSTVLSKTSVARVSTTPGVKTTATAAPKMAAQARPNKAIHPPTNASTSKPSSRIEKASPVLRASSRLTSKLKKDNPTTVVPESTRLQTRSMSKAAGLNLPTKAAANYEKVSRTKAELQPKTKKMTGLKKTSMNCTKSVSTRNTKTQKCTVNKIVNPSNRTVSARNTKKGHTEDEKMDISIEISNPPASGTEGIMSPPSSPKEKKYAPVCPSPLLRSTSARRRDTLFSAPVAISDPAWIPGIVIEPRFNQANFDEAFGNEFSPFRFGNSDSSFHFSFRKSTPHLDSFSGDSLCETSTNCCVAPDSKIVRHSLGSAGHAIRHVTTNEDEMVVEVVSTRNFEEQVSCEDMEVTTKPGIDIPYFRKLHSDVTDTLTVLCDLWDEKVAGLVRDVTDVGAEMEEVLGQLRTTVGQGRLLMRQKMKQYLGLVDTVEKQGGGMKTTSEDLQGFWDMLYYQVQDVLHKFKCAEHMEENGWRIQRLTPKQKKAKKRQIAVKPVNASNGKETDRQKEARQKRDAQRNRLREMKQAAKRHKEVAVTSEKENFVPPLISFDD